MIVGLFNLFTSIALAGAGVLTVVDGDASMLDRVFPCVVKLYGGAGGLEHGYGVGVLVKPDGHVVTASSVLLDSDRLRAVLRDGRTVAARVVRRDERLHLALLRIEARDLPCLTPALQATLRPGDTVIAMGNSFKVAEGEERISVSRGVFSMRTRLDARRRKQPFNYRGDVLLYDAITANPGMAGGPLLDAEGRWVGLIGKIVTSERTNTFLSYALPADVVQEFLEPPSVAASAPPTSQPEGAAAGDVEAAGRARPPHTGIRLFEMGFRQNAAYVDRVEPGSPAETAGLRGDDLILAVNGRQVRSAGDFQRMMAEARPGQRVSLSVKRGRDVLMIDLTLAAPK